MSGMCVPCKEVRGQRMGVSALLPAWESWGWNPGFQAWGPVPLPAESLALFTLHIIYVYRGLSPGLGETIQWLHSQIFDIFILIFLSFDAGLCIAGWS